ncbi:MAG: fumarylacetoacetate hydrolase family protein [Sulfitobacter sp.]
MRLVSFKLNGEIAGGIQTDKGIIPFSAFGDDVPKDVASVIEGGQSLQDTILLRLHSEKDLKIHDIADVIIVAPIPTPRRNIFCVGKNYHAHAKEFQDSGFDSSSSGQESPDVPIVFTKAPSSVIGPNESILSELDPTGTLDYEGELAVIIGIGGRGIKAADAMAHVYGYSIINDVTARETQNLHKQWFLGKSPDTFCPFGPAIVTSNEISDVGKLTLKTVVNGELRQDAIVSDLIFDIPTIIETISAAITLQPGDIIATGTPVGVAIGFKPPRYLKSGDTVSVEISNIGSISNPVA